MAEIRKIFLTGRPGAGKTTAILNALGMLQCEKHGFYTREIREAGRRVGFEIRDLQGNSAVMAHVDLPGDVGVGKYGVDVEAVDRIGVSALLKALEQGRLAVVDEVGKMELASPRFRRTILDVIRSQIPILGTMHGRRDQYTELIREREDTGVWNVTRKNRDEIPARLAHLFRLGP